MALVLNDRVKETTTTTGTGTVNLAGAETGFETFVAGVGNSNTCYYCIAHQSADEFEVGLGTVTDATPDTLARTTVISSSNSDSAVDFSAGTKDVFCTLPASKAVFEDGSGNLEIDVGGVIKLDADGAEIQLKDGGTEIGQIDLGSANFTLRASTSDKDMIFRVNDGGTEIVALTIDASEGGDAIFGGKIQANGALKFNSNTGTPEFQFFGSGTETGVINLASSNFNIESKVSDKDIIFKGVDGGSDITALTIDMSEAGAATFNDNVTAYSDERLKENIRTIENGLDKVEQLRGVTYTRDEKESIGVIAQEVEKILPEIVLTADDEMGTKSVDYGRLTAVLIEAVKDLSAKVKELEDR